MGRPALFTAEDKARVIDFISKCPAGTTEMDTFMHKLNMNPEVPAMRAGVLNTWREDCQIYGTAIIGRRGGKTRFERNGMSAQGAKPPEAMPATRTYTAPSRPATPNPLFPVLPSITPQLEPTIHETVAYHVPKGHIVILAPLREGTPIPIGMPRDATRQELEALGKYIAELPLPNDKPAGAVTFTNIHDASGKRIIPVKSTPENTCTCDSDEHEETCPVAVKIAKMRKARETPVSPAKKGAPAPRKTPTKSRR